MKYRRPLAQILTVTLLAGAGWLGHREWVFRAEEPLRDGTHAWEVGDNATAWKTLLPLAKRGDGRAQRTIAYMYALGSGVPADEVRAQMWSRRAECGCSTPGAIEYDIAFEYLDDRDEAKALIWFRRAAEAGHPEAQRLLVSPERLSEKRLEVDPQLVRYWQGVFATDSN